MPPGRTVAAYDPTQYDAAGNYIGPPEQQAPPPPEEVATLPPANYIPGSTYVPPQAAPVDPTGGLMTPSQYNAGLYVGPAATYDATTAPEGQAIGYGQFDPAYTPQGSTFGYTPPPRDPYQAAPLALDQHVGMGRPSISSTGSVAANGEWLPDTAWDRNALFGNTFRPGPPAPPSSPYRSDIMTLPPPAQGNWFGPVNADAVMGALTTAGQGLGILPQPALASSSSKTNQPGFTTGAGGGGGGPTVTVTRGVGQQPAPRYPAGSPPPPATNWQGGVPGTSATNPYGPAIPAGIAGGPVYGPPIPPGFFPSTPPLTMGLPSLGAAALPAALAAGSIGLGAASPALEQLWWSGERWLNDQQRARTPGYWTPTDTMRPPAGYESSPYWSPTTTMRPGGSVGSATGAPSGGPTSPTAPATPSSTASPTSPVAAPSLIHDPRVQAAPGGEGMIAMPMVVLDENGQPQLYGAANLPTDRYLPETLANAGLTVRVLTDADVDTLIASGQQITDAAKSLLVGQRLIVPQAWADILGAGAPTATETGVPAGSGAVTNPLAGAASDTSASSGGGNGGGYDSGGGYGKSYGNSYGGEHRRGGYNSGPSGGYDVPDLGAMFADMGGESERDMMSDPLFARYFEVLSRHFGPDRARLLMRGFSRRFGRSFGRSSRVMRGSTTRTKSRSGTTSVPTNAGIRTQVMKQIAGKKKT